MASDLVIAISGHRPNRLLVGEQRITWQTRAMLRVFARTARGLAVPMRPVAVSALAEGSDRTFAAAALDLDMPLQVLLPFSVAAYETTFGDAARTPQFRTLLARAELVTELSGRLDDSGAGYEAVGRACVDACHVLVAVWDGKPAAGRGGTPDVIQYALGMRKPVVWIHAAERRDPSLLPGGAAPPLKAPLRTWQLRDLVAATGRRSDVTR